MVAMPRETNDACFRRSVHGDRQIVDDDHLETIAMTLRVIAIINKTISIARETNDACFRRSVHGDRHIVDGDHWENGKP